MGRKKLSMSEKIRRYMSDHPSAAPADIARVLEVKIALVYAVRKLMKANAKPKVKAVTSVVVAADNNVSPQPQPTTVVADPVNHPVHYTSGGIETIDFLQAKLTKEEFIGYLKGNVLKYGSRIGKKGEAHVDAGKLAWYSLKLNDMYRQA